MAVMQVLRVVRYLFVGLVILSFAGVDTTAFAERAKTKRRAKSKAHQEGEYGGVTPETDHPPHRKRRPKRPTLTWTGFQVRNGSQARLFLQLSHDADYTQQLDKNNVLVVFLPGFRFGEKNAARRIDARYFGTVLSEVRGHRVRRRRARGDIPARAAGVELRITFRDAKQAVEAQASMKTVEDGYRYLYLDFPSPTSTFPSRSFDDAVQEGDSVETDVDDDIENDEGE